MPKEKEMGNLEDSLDTGSDKGTPSDQVLQDGPGLGEEGGTKRQPDDTSSVFTPEYKSHEEAERAVKEAKRALTKANEEKSRLYKMLQRLEKPADGTGIRKDTPQKKIVREALAQIDRISAEDPDRADKIAEIWADANEKISDMRVSSRFQEHTNLQEGIRYAEDKAKQSFAKIGIKPDSKAAKIALKIFWAIAPTAPSMDFEEQLDWTTNEIIAGINDLRAGDKEKVAEEEKETEGLKGVIGKGGRIPPEKKEVKTEHFTLGDLQNELEKERVVK